MFSLQKFAANKSLPIKCEMQIKILKKPASAKYKTKTGKKFCIRQKYLFNHAAIIFLLLIGALFI